MTPIMVKERVTNLEKMMADLIRNTEIRERKFDRFVDEMKDFKDEMRDFKDEMTDFKDEMRGFKDEMRGFKDEMTDFKDEMTDFKDEMTDFKDKMEIQNNRMNKRWGELSNKMGTLAEDLVAPSIPNILKKVVNCPDNAIDSVSVRNKRLHPVTRKQQEFDVVAVCGEYVLINETKSSLKAEHIDDFTQLMLKAREFYPEYAAKKFIGAIASLYIDHSLVTFGTKKGLIVLGFMEGAMVVLNKSDFTPQAF